MADAQKPEHYQSIEDRFPDVLKSLEELGRAARDNSPFDEKTTHLLQLSAAAAIQSEGAVHSHTRRALAAGAHHDELYGTAILLVSTIGFPRVAATISWIDDVVEDGA